MARRLLAADETAFARFFDWHAPRLYRFALARVDGDEDVAEEILQKTLIRAFAKLHTYRAEAALLTWLCTLCRREIGAWLRNVRRFRHRERRLTDVEEVRAVLETIGSLPHEDPQRRLLRRELRLLVQATLDRLPADYGRVLEWKYVDGVAVREIARRLGVSLAAAQSKLSRARVAFREGFGPLAPALATIEDVEWRS